MHLYWCINFFLAMSLLSPVWVRNASLRVALVPCLGDREWRVGRYTCVKYRAMAGLILNHRTAKMNNGQLNIFFSFSFKVAYNGISL